MVKCKTKYNNQPIGIQHVNTSQTKAGRSRNEICKQYLSSQFQIRTSNAIEWEACTGETPGHNQLAAEKDCYQADGLKWEVLS